MFNLFLQFMHVTNAYVILFLASVKTGETGILYTNIDLKLRNT